MENETTDFIRQRIQSDIEGDVLSQGVVTRFPPEPNGFLHIGHAKSICLNFGVSEQFSGTTFLRFDDTNPQKESEEFVESIKADVAWLGFSWGALTHASDYFEQIYQYAVDLISNGKAYVCSLDAEQMRISRGTLTEPGTNSPYRDRSVEDNLDLFQRMRAGEFADGEHIVRLKIDMASPNMNYHPPQIEFSRLGLEYTVMSKRLLHRLVDEKLVSGWDDPRMPTIAGLRRRGVRAAAIRDFCARIGITKQDNTVEMNLLDFCIRKDLESSAPRGMGVLEPLKVVLTNFQDDIELEGPWHPQNADLGTRKLPFSRELWIEQSDFSENPPGKWKRLSPGEMVRLRYAFIIRCDGVEYDGDGNVVQLNCTYFPDSKSGEDTSGLKPKGVVHWVDAKQSVAVEVRDYDRLFNVPSPSAKTFIDDINEQSLTTLHAMVEPAMMALGEQHFQFERQGYFCKDSELPGVFNKTVSLREGF